jgi:hypothetical protein
MIRTYTLLVVVGFLAGCGPILPLPTTEATTTTRPTGPATQQAPATTTTRR